MIRKKGFTLVEGICSLLIITIVIIGVLNFYKISNRLLLTTEVQTTSNSNLRIAQEFLAERIRKGSSITVGDKIIIIDNNSIYVENGILRYGTSSQQISPDIESVLIEDIGNDLYKIILNGKNEKLLTIVKRGLEI